MSGRHQRAGAPIGDGGGPTRAMAETGRAVAARAAGVLVFGIAFGYVEAAVVVYLQTALGIAPGGLFPLREAGGEASRLIAIEVGRELATLVMLAAAGVVAGASRWERLAWLAVAFGAWDIAYYGWLRLFIGWPYSPSTWDVLFLVPAPWVGPVWAPVSVSLALVGVGIAAASRLRGGMPLAVTRWTIAAGVAGGVLVVASFLAGAPETMAGGAPESFAWPLFGAGMAVALGAAAAAFAQADRA